MRKTKIICTLGPAVDSDEMIEQLIENGMDCARLNFSHGNHEEQKVRIDRVKRVREKMHRNTPILLDTKGPEIRLRNFEGGAAFLEEGQLFTLCADKNLMGNKERAGLSFGKLAENVSVGTVILVDDGKIKMTVQEINGADVVCKLDNSGLVSNHKSINIPDAYIDMPYISKIDKNDILFGIEQDVDYIAASFVRSPEDVKALRAILLENGGERIKIISKIENQSGIDAIDEIIDLSDGIMVARGDMGVEVPFAKLPAIQKDVITKCRKKGKIVITATQMLESMTNCIRPTRAEVSDVANAIYDGTTVIMLSGESAAGKYPIESVRTMAEIAAETENDINYMGRFQKNNVGESCNDFREAVALATASTAYSVNAKAIVCMSISGKTVENIARYNLSIPIIAPVTDAKVLRQLELVWNVKPILVKEVKTTDELFDLAVLASEETRIVSKGDIIIITGSAKMGFSVSDVMKLHKV